MSEAVTLAERERQLAAAPESWRAIERVLWLVTETELAVKVSQTGRREDEVWLPRSLVVFDEGAPLGYGRFAFTLPAWLAAEKGLL